MQRSIHVVALACVALVGCAPANIVRLKAPVEKEKAELIVYRESAFNAMGSALIFGADKQDVVKLNNGQYTRLQLPVGAHTFYARSAGADVPFELKASLLYDKPVCLKAVANPANLAKSLLPVSYLVGSTFVLEPVSCLPEAELAKYALIQVEYESR